MKKPVLGAGGSRQHDEMGVSLVMRIQAAIVAMENDDALDFAISEVVKRPKKCDGRRRRRGGWKNLKPRYGDATATTYLKKWRYRYWESPIWKQLQDEDTHDEGCFQAADFRAEYGVPRLVFDEFVELAESTPGLECKSVKGSSKIKGACAIPLSHKLACCLWKWRAGCSWRALKKVGQVSEPMIRKWWHTFTKLTVQAHYAKYVHPPTAPDEIQRRLDRSAKLGVPGCLTWCDGVPVR